MIKSNSKRLAGSELKQYPILLKTKFFERTCLGRLCTKRRASVRLTSPVSTNAEAAEEGLDFANCPSRLTSLRSWWRRCEGAHILRRREQRIWGWSIAETSEARILLKCIGCGRHHSATGVGPGASTQAVRARFRMEGLRRVVLSRRCRDFNRRRCADEAERGNVRQMYNVEIHHEG